jgi:hypothetical protein
VTSYAKPGLPRSWANPCCSDKGVEHRAIIGGADAVARRCGRYRSAEVEKGGERAPN